MEVHVYLKNGFVDRMIPHSLQAMREILIQVQDAKFFERTSVVIAGHDSIMAYPGSAITRVDFLLDSIPDDWKMTEPNRMAVTEISEAEWQARFWLPKNALPHRMVMHCAIQLIDGTRVIIKVSGVKPSEADQRQLFGKAFTFRGNPVCQRLDGGISVWNPSHIISYELYPLLQTPTTAWNADWLGESSLLKEAA